MLRSEVIDATTTTDAGNPREFSPITTSCQHRDRAHADRSYHSVASRALAIILHVHEHQAIRAFQFHDAATPTPLLPIQPGYLRFDRGSRYEIDHRGARQEDRFAAQAAGTGPVLGGRVRFAADLIGGGIFGFRPLVLHELDGAHQPLAAHIAHMRMRGQRGLQTLQQMRGASRPLAAGSLRVRRSPASSALRRSRPDGRRRR